jgi:hypothetical protein
MVELLLWAAAVAALVLVVGGLAVYAVCEAIDSMLEDSKE